jgi:hypothetical protein
MKDRTNEEWLAALRGPEKEVALADLRGPLVRGLRAALHGRTGDFVQEALLKFLGSLDTAEAMPLVHEHLHMCGECREEFEALLTALSATGEA